MRIRTSHLVSLGIIASVIFACSISSAQTVDELRQSIVTKTAEIQKLEQEIEKYKTDLSKIATLKANLKTLIASLDATRKKLEAEIRLTSNKVESTDLKIRKLESDISYKTNEIESLNAALTEALREIRERDTLSLPEIALSHESFAGLWVDLDTIGQFNDSVYDNILALKRIKDDLELAQNEREAEKKNLLDLKSELSDRKKIAEENKNQNSKLLAQTNNQESEYARILKQKIALKDAFERELQDYEATLKFILDPSSIPPRGTRVFAAPLDSVVITQKFGKTSSSGRLYASGTHNGVDFGTPVGTQVKTMLSGTVVGTGNTDLTCPGASYGKWILVRHNNGLASLYAHLSLVKSSPGDKVQTGDVIGYSGNTGYSTGPHLHLTVFAANGVQIESRASKACGGKSYTMPFAALNAYLDPLDYL